MNNHSKMESSKDQLIELLAQTTILSQICNNLTFEEAVQIKSTLRLNVLECPIVIQDSDQKIMKLPQVDDVHIQIYRLIKGGGSNSALIKSIQDQNEEIALQLINLGANIEATDKYQNTALVWASLSNLPKVVRELLNRGANLNAKNWNGSTPLILTAGNSSSVEILEMLIKEIQKYPNPLDYINARGWNGESALSAALYSKQSLCSMLRFEKAKLLLKAGANIEARDDFGNTVLNRVAFFLEEDQEDVINFLIDNGANIETQNDGGRTPLLNSTFKGIELTILTLLKRGANINTVSQYGQTALMSAVMSDHPNAVKILIEHGANTRMRDNDGKTAYELAKQYKGPVMVNYLSQHQS